MNQIQKLKDEAYQDAYQKAYKEAYQEGFAKGQHIAALEVATNLFSMRTDPCFIKHTIRFLIREVTGLSNQEILELENS
ncbi:hypothetical protein [Rickettsiella endosymbiont of Miltochrista miniata]|uniref:hypothetical protein n=1 Tax=Rickettsiella endosymbiont of Miltochrista miniata TaxID=3066239 RepID=UPI00313A81B5